MWKERFKHEEIKNKKFQRLVKTEGKFEYTLKWKSYRTEEYSCGHVFRADFENEGIDNFIYDNGEFVHTSNETVDMDKFFEVNLEDYGFTNDYCVCPECYLKQSGKMLDISNDRFLYYRTKADTFKETMNAFIEVKDLAEVVCTNEVTYNNIALIITGNVRLAYMAEVDVYYQESDGCFHAEWGIYEDYDVCEDEDGEIEVDEFDAEEILLKRRFFEHGECQYFVHDFEIKGIYIKTEYLESLSKGELMVLRGFCRNNGLKVYNEKLDEIEI